MAWPRSSPASSAQPARKHSSGERPSKVPNQPSECPALHWLSPYFTRSQELSSSLRFRIRNECRPGETRGNHGKNASQPAHRVLAFWMVLPLDFSYTKTTIDRCAHTLRALRQEAKATLNDLAIRSGLSASTLSKIENGRLSPTYETLLRLADGLRVDIAALFNAQAPQSSSNASTCRRSITRRGNGHLHVTPQYEYEMFCSDLFRKQFTPLVTTITARSVNEFTRLPRHEGEEFVYVLSGEIELHTEHYEAARLCQGDGCYFDSAMGHACISVSHNDAVVLWIASSADGLRPSRTDRDR